MNPLPLQDQENIRWFIKSLHLRHARSPTIYTCILRDFQRFVIEESASQPPSAETVRRWLEERILRWPLHIVFHRARLVDRFLGWMKAGNRLANNPLQELRREYGQRTTTPITRALLSPNSAAALEELRPLPPFGSFLGSRMREHVTLMRSMGQRYDVYASRLRRFDRFLQGRPDLVAEPLPVLIEAWRQAGDGLQHKLESQQCGRILSKAWRRADPTVVMIPTDPHLERRVRAHHRRPYIYTEEEVRRLLATARSFPSPLAPLRPLSLYTMLVLAYCAGLRISEIVHLDVGDVNIEEATVDIRCTKFFKSRRLPLTPSVVDALKCYLDARRAAGAPSLPSAGLFWHQQAAGRYSTVMAGKLLVRVLRRSGLKSGHGKIGPRIHDLRHAFVVHRMLTWYRSGTNPQSKLPYLATYLGHKDINSTLIYLTITQELMQHASERFRVRGAAVLGSTADQP
jgi:integrase/recombinase XerD